MSKRKWPRPQILRKGAYTALLKDALWERDTEIERTLNQPNPTRMYQHPNGNALWIISDRVAHLYESRQEMLAICHDLQKETAKGPQHVLSERLLYGREFDRHIPDLIVGLAHIFGMSAETFDYNPTGGPTLETMTRKVRARGRMRCVNDPAIFSGLVAYLSETGRRAVNGRIEMIDSWQHPGVWEPWVLDPQGNAFNVWLNLYDTLYENEYGIALGIGIDIKMRQPNKFAPPPPRPLDQLDRVSLNLTIKPDTDAADEDAAPDP